MLNDPLGSNCSQEGPRTSDTKYCGVTRGFESESCVENQSNAGKTRTQQEFSPAARNDGIADITVSKLRNGPLPIPHVP